MSTTRKLVRADSADRFIEIRDEIIEEGAARLAAITSAGTTQAAAVTAAGAASIATMGGLVTQAQTSANNANNSAQIALLATQHTGSYDTKALLNAALAAGGTLPAGTYLVLADESKTGSPPWVYRVAADAISGPGYGALLPNAENGLNLPASLRFTGAEAVGSTTLRPFFEADTDAPAAFASGMSRLANPGLTRDHWVWWAGFNYGPGASRIDNTRHAAGIFIEDYFGNAGQPLSEAYHQIAFENGEGIRPWAVYANVDRTHATRTGVGGTKKAALIFDGDAFTVQRPAGGGNPALSMFTVEEVYTGGVTRVEGGIAGDWQIAGRLRPLGKAHIDVSAEMRAEAANGADAFVSLFRMTQSGDGFPAGVGFEGATGHGLVTRYWQGADPWYGDKTGMNAWANYNPDAAEPAWNYVAVIRGAGVLELLEPGAGTVYRTPDGTKRYLHSPDNNGDIIKTLLNDGGDTTVGGVSMKLGKIDSYLI